MADSVVGLKAFTLAQIAMIVWDETGSWIARRHLKKPAHVVHIILVCNQKANCQFSVKIGLVEIDLESLNHIFSALRVKKAMHSTIRAQIREWRKQGLLQVLKEMLRFFSVARIDPAAGSERVQSLAWGLA